MSDQEFLAIIKEWLGATDETDRVESLMAEGEELAKRYQPE